MIPNNATIPAVAGLWRAKGQTPLQQREQAACDYQRQEAQSYVLVVDDEPALVQLVCEVLQDAGLETQGCLTSRQAETYIAEYLPELIVLDVQMPEVSGIELFRRLRAVPLTCAIPVIFLTANTHILREYLPDFLDHDAAVLAKPFRLDRLVALVGRMTTY